MSFNRSIQSIATTHAVKDVLDPEYLPPVEEEAVFKVKNTFMYSVFNTNLLTDMGKIHRRWSVYAVWWEFVGLFSIKEVFYQLKKG